MHAYTSYTNPCLDAYMLRAWTNACIEATRARTHTHSHARAHKNMHEQAQKHARARSKHMHTCTSITSRASQPLLKSAAISWFG